MAATPASDNPKAGKMTASMFLICSTHPIESDHGPTPPQSPRKPHEPRHRPPRRGRGAVSNASGRFETESPVTRDEDFAFDDGWGGAKEAAPTRTTVERDTSRTILAHNTSPDIPFDRSINPYRGCEHGCFYCFARPTHAFLGLSPGLDFETRLFAKLDAGALLAATLLKPGYNCRMIAIGTNTDPYQPIEEDYGITGDVLKVLSAFNHPVGIVTKGARHAI